MKNRRAVLDAKRGEAEAEAQQKDAEQKKKKHKKEKKNKKDKRKDHHKSHKKTKKMMDLEVSRLGELFDVEFPLPRHMSGPLWMAFFATQVQRQYIYKSTHSHHFYSFRRPLKLPPPPPPPRKLLLH